MFRLVSLFLLVFGLLAGCSAPSGNVPPSLEDEAARINARFAAIRASVERLRAAAEDIYANPGRYDAPSFPNRIYVTYQDSLVYAKEPDGKSSVLATGYVPVDKALMGKLKRMEHLEPLLAKEAGAQGWISMSWVAARDCLGVFYPPFDMLALCPPRLNTPVDILPYRKAAEGNPSRGPVWVEPYVDITGKGYMATVSVPVISPERPGEVEAVAGNDVALEPVVRDLAGPGFADRMLVSKDLYVIAVGERLGRVLGVEALGQVYYLRQVKGDVPAPEKFRLDRSPDWRLRDLGAFISGVTGETRFPWEGGALQLRVVPIPETGWRLVEGVLR